MWLHRPLKDEHAGTGSCFCHLQRTEGSAAAQMAQGSCHCRQTQGGQAPHPDRQALSGVAGSVLLGAPRHTAPCGLRPHWRRLTAPTLLDSILGEQGHGDLLPHSCGEWAGRRPARARPPPCALASSAPSPVPPRLRALPATEDTLGTQRVALF